MTAPSRHGRATKPHRESRMRGSIVPLSCLLLAVHVTAAPALAQSGVATNPGLAPQGRYAVVRDHTQVFFSIMHLGLSPYYGRFAGATGTLNFNPRDPPRSTLAIEIDPKPASTLSDLVSRQLCGDTRPATSRAISRSPESPSR